MLTGYLSKYQKVGLLLVALTVLIYVVTFIAEMRLGFSILHGLNYLAIDFREINYFCNETVHSQLPNDTIIDEMDVDSLYETFLRYSLRQQIRCCNVSRAGPSNSFGKNVCMDRFQNVRNACLVYSFGSEMHFEFENSILENYNCEIHTFDPSLSTKRLQIPAGVHYHLTGLSDSDKTVSAAKRYKDFSNWTMKTLSSIRKSLNHEKRNVDILKIDIEGWEWKVIPDVIQSRDLKYVKQLCLEVHFGFKFKHIMKGKRLVTYRYVNNSTWGNVSIQNQLKALRYLYMQGFRIFKSDPLKGWGIYHLRKSKKKINTLIEISLVNLNN